MLKAAIYARYSSALQHPSSIDDQVALCRRQAPRFECTVLDDHVYTDAEISGSEERRDGYQRLLAAARLKAFDAIIVEGQDRLWRNQAEMHTALRRLQFWGIKVFSVATGTDLTDKAGKLIATVIGWKDEAYLEDLREKTHRGLAGRALRGLSAGGRTFGYRTEPVVDATRPDAHGQPLLVGYRRVIAEDEAQVVRRIFEEYASGRSPKAIIRDLNRDRIPPPRGPRAKGWTWTALVGNPRLGTGILNNALYVGKATWNRFRWEKDPETGKRVPRLRPQDDWIVVEHPELRIVPQELWDRVKTRHPETRRESTTPGPRGRGPKYLFSGLLRCGVCGARYTVYNSTYYGCSFHTNRGNTICANGKVVHRNRLEKRLLETIQQEVFTPDAIAYLTERVQEELKRLLRQQQTQADRRSMEQALAQALKEREYIKDAIRRGLVGEITREMLDEVETRIRDLQARLERVVLPMHVIAGIALPEAIQTRLRDLDKVLGLDVGRARGLLRELLGDIVLRPTPGGLVAELRGNAEGLLDLEKTLPAGLTGNSGSGGRI